MFFVRVVLVVTLVAVYIQGKKIPRDGTCVTRPSPVPLPKQLPSILIDALNNADQVVTQIMRKQNSPGTSLF